MKLLHIIFLIEVEFILQSTTGDCQKNELPCISGTCIKNENWCDSEYDCEDCSDEMYCHEDSCPQHFFQCQNKRCIPESAVCNQFDNCGDGSDEICNGTHDKRPAIQAVIKAAEYLIRMRETDYGWDSFTPRAIVALAFAENVFYIPEQEKLLMKKLLNVQILLDLMKNEELSLVHLAHYINALYAMCQNPRNFHGMDLVYLLRSKTDKTLKSNFNLPMVLMTVCIAGAQKTNDVGKLISMYNDTRNDLKGFKALTVVALMACRYRNRVSWSNHKQNFLQYLRSGYGKNDIYTDALSNQALNAMGKSHKDYLWTRQFADGSFGDLLSTYYAIPALLNTSLLTLKCNGPRYNEMPSGTALNGDVRKSIAYSLRTSDEDVDSHTMLITIEGNRTFYDVMMIAQSRDPVYRFEYDQTPDGKVVYCLGDLPNDSEAGLSWKLHLKENDSTMYSKSKLNEVTSGIEKNFPEDGSHFVFWRKRTN